MNIQGFGGQEELLKKLLQNRGPQSTEAAGVNASNPFGGQGAQSANADKSIFAMAQQGMQPQQANAVQGLKPEEQVQQAGLGNNMQMLEEMLKKNMMGGLA